MKKTLILRWVAVVLLFCIAAGCIAGCGKEIPEPAETAEETTYATEPVIDTRTWAERTVEAFAAYSGIPASAYPQNMLILLEKNPEAIGFVLRYPQDHDKTFDIDMSPYENSQTVPLFIQWDQRWGYIPYGADVAGVTACGPLCLSMVAYYLTGDENMRPDKMIQFAIEDGHCVRGNGSAWTLISQGAKKLGLNVKELPLVKGRILTELNNGNPVICVMGPGIFTSTGHFIVLTGYEDGKFRVNDPNSVVRSGQLWSYEEIQDQIRNLWAISLP